MKYLNGKPAMKGDTVLFSTPDGTIMAGNVSQFYERTEQLQVSGYPLRVYAADAILAADGYAAVAEPIWQADKEAKEKAMREAAEAEAKEKAMREAAEAEAKAKAEQQARSEATDAPQSTPAPTEGVQTPPTQSNAS